MNLLLAFIIFGLNVVNSVTTEGPQCDLKLGANACPHGFCCATDEFVPTYTFCKRIGYLGDHCATRPSRYDCPCRDGLYCKPNIAGHITSLYGTCFHKQIAYTQDPTTTTDLPTTTARQSASSTIEDRRNEVPLQVG